MDLPVLITKSCSFNFLREFWHENKDTLCSGKELLQKAKHEFNKLSLEEKQLFQEVNYINTRLSTDIFSMQMATDFVPDVLRDAKKRKPKTSRSKSKAKSKLAKTVVAKVDGK